MQLVHQFEVAAPLERTWAFFHPARIALEGAGDLPDDHLGRIRGRSICLADPRDDGRGRLRPHVGAQERVLELLPDIASVTAEDRALASAVSATLRLALTSDDGDTRVTLHTEANVLGKLGQFGQGAIKLAADSVMKQFAGRVRERLASQESVAATEPVDRTNRTDRS